MTSLAPPPGAFPPPGGPRQVNKLTMNYQKLTKAQLIDRIEELEKQTVAYKINSIASETKALMSDVVKLVFAIYMLGVKTRSAYDNSMLSLYIDELRDRSKDFYKSRVKSISESSEDEVVLVPR